MPLIQFLPIWAIGFVLWHLCCCLLRTAQRARKNLMNACSGGRLGLFGQLDHRHHHLRQQSAMEDLTEIFTLPSWPDVNGTNRCPWDHHGAAMLQSYYPLPDMLQNDGAQMKQHQGPAGDPSFYGGPSNPSSSDVDSAGHHSQLYSCGMQEAAALDALRRIQEGSGRALGPSMKPPSAGSGGCDMSRSSGSPMLPPWHPSYIGGLSASPPGLGPGKSEAFLLPDGPHSSSHLRGRRDDDNAQNGPGDGNFIPICGAQAQQLRTPGQQSHPQAQVSHAISAPSFSGLTGIGQPQGAAAVVAGTARPRVRARRGQATDPHSIAERLRRERIADRMKALQELVPNANKTDKASMLDEIIEYVRFLQLQVKILSMSRLSGTSAVATLVTEIPGEGLLDLSAMALLCGGGAACSSHDSLIATERQVARLMEESMGSALQFLQGKGLCLMPISLVAATSRNTARPATGSSQGKTEASLTSMRASSSTAMAIPSAHCASDMVAMNEVSSSMRGISGGRGREAMSPHDEPKPSRSTMKPMANITKTN